MKKLLQSRTYLWIFTAILIAVMSMGMYLTHPVKNMTWVFFEVWMCIFIFVLGASILANSLFREKWLDKKFGHKQGNYASPVYKIEEKFAGRDIGQFGFIASNDGVEFVIVIGAIILGLISGSFFGILMIGVEFLLLKLFKIEQNPITHAYKIVWIFNLLMILYSAYFITLFILKFLWKV